MRKFEFNMFASDKGILVYNGDNPLLQGITLNPNFKVTDEENGVDAVATTHAYLAYLTDMLASGEFVVNQKLLYRLPAQTAPQAPHAPHDDDLASLGGGSLVPISEGLVEGLQAALDGNEKTKGQTAVAIKGLAVGQRDGQRFVQFILADDSRVKAADRSGKEAGDEWKNPFADSKKWDFDFLGIVLHGIDSGRDVTFDVAGVIAVSKTGEYTNFKKWLKLNGYKAR
jgi:hypothetical protein